MPVLYAADRAAYFFEYAMIQHMNDSDACAKELAGRLHGMLCHVNLIPVNDVTGNSYKKSAPGRLQKFIDILGERDYRYGTPDAGLGYRRLRAAFAAG